MNSALFFFQTKLRLTICRSASSLQCTFAAAKRRASTTFFQGFVRCGGGRNLKKSYRTQVFLEVWALSERVFIFRDKKWFPNDFFFLSFSDAHDLQKIIILTRCQNAAGEPYLFFHVVFKSKRFVNHLVLHVSKRNFKDVHTVESEKGPKT